MNVEPFYSVPITLAIGLCMWLAVFFISTPAQLTAVRHTLVHPVEGLSA
jgi:hypothetical protein